MSFLNSIFKRDTSTNIITQIIAENAAGNIEFKKIAINMAISYVSSAISNCNFKVYENGKQITNNHLNYVLNFAPNRNQSAPAFWKEFIENYYYCGQVLIFKIGDSFYNTPNFQKTTNGLAMDSFESVSYHGKQLEFPFYSSSAMYFGNDNYNNGEKQLINSIYEEYQNLLSYTSDYYLDEHRNSYIYDLDSMENGTDETQNEFAKKIKNAYSNYTNKKSGLWVQHKGQSLSKMKKGTVKSDDFINLRKDFFEIVSQTFKIPITMLTGNMTNCDDIINQFLTFCVDPVAEMISKEITKFYFTEKEITEKNNYVKVDTSAIKHIELFGIADKIDKLIACGAYTINDVRTKAGDDFVDDKICNEHIITKNYDLLENVKGGEMNE